MTPQVIEKNVDTFKHLSSAQRLAISSLNNLSELYTGGFLITEFKRVQTPVTEVDQSYFWTDEWQRDEQAVDDEFKKGKFKKFSNPKDAVAYLRE